VQLATASTTNLTGQQTIAQVTFTAIGLGAAPVTFAATSAVDEPNGTDDTGTLTGSTYTVADMTAPTVPTGLTATSRAATSVAFSWTAATDNVAVTGYKIYRNGTQVGTTATTSYTDTGLTPGTAYSYTVAAYDAAGNLSAQSAAKQATTSLVVGDVNGDGVVNIEDLAIMAATWQSTTNLRADLNHDGIVNVSDLSILAANYGK
jgi:hypothetical protein